MEKWYKESDVFRSHLQRANDFRSFCPQPRSVSIFCLYKKKKKKFFFLSVLFRSKDLSYTTPKKGEYWLTPWFDPNSKTCRNFFNFGFYSDILQLRLSGVYLRILGCVLSKVSTGKRLVESYTQMSQWLYVLRDSSHTNNQIDRIRCIVATSCSVNWNTNFYNFFLTWGTNKTYCCRNVFPSWALLERKRKKYNSSFTGIQSS